MNSRSAKIRIATRASKLALWQARFVASGLEAIGFDHELIPLTTQGDIILDHPLQDIGGKGLFIKELETALLAGRADIAVHSLKDLPVRLPDDFVLGAILPRHSPNDIMIFHPDVKRRMKIKDGVLSSDDLFNLGKMTIATSSLRRSALLKQHLPLVNIVPVRGNIDTRIRKMLENDWDGLILAEAGIKRLGLEHTVTQRTLASDFFIPAPAQGALAIEVCKHSPYLATISQLACALTTALVGEERRLLELLGGDCTLPIGCLFQTDQSSKLTGQAIVFDERGMGITAEVCAENWCAEGHQRGQFAKELFKQFIAGGYHPR